MHIWKPIKMCAHISFIVCFYLFVNCLKQSCFDRLSVRRIAILCEYFVVVITWMIELIYLLSIVNLISFHDSLVEMANKIHEHFERYGKYIEALQSIQNDSGWWLNLLIPIHFFSLSYEDAHNWLLNIDRLVKLKYDFIIGQYLSNKKSKWNALYSIIAKHRGVIMNELFLMFSFRLNEQSCQDTFYTYRSIIQ